jgi:hypothetical protein
MRGGAVDFYSAAAQIIPVLMLVIVVEQRSEGAKRHAPLENLLYFITATTAALFGEVVSLGELYRGGSAPSDQYWVIIPLGVLAVALVLPIVRSAFAAVEAENRLGKTMIAYGLFAACVGALLTLGLAVHHIG